jgi:L-alanine-DL-glutamate epimerase-like enolase superfamily enzyme
MHEHRLVEQARQGGAALDLAPRKVQAWIYRNPVEREIRTSFGAMGERQTVFIRVEDDQGHEGWGEVWCNFPPRGADHRANLVREVLAPLLTARTFPHPVAAFGYLSEATSKLALQCGEAGPFAQAIAGLDVACWDLVARRAGVPLWRMLGGRPEVPTYASGLEMPDFLDVARARWDEGHRAFKLKVGFEAERDLDNLRMLRKVLPPRARLMVDANQGWTLEEALPRIAALRPYQPEWVEEPLTCDRPHAEWLALHAAQGRDGIALAAGENLAQRDKFDEAIEAGYLQVVQPDAGKWGGVSGGYAVGRAAVQAGRMYCPHWLSGGIGQLASLHLLAAVGGPGLLEVDSKSNPMREQIGLDLHVVDGMVRLPETPGITGGLDLSRVEQYRVAEPGQDGPLQSRRDR